MWWFCNADWIRFKRKGSRAIIGNSCFSARGAEGWHAKILRLSVRLELDDYYYYC